MKKLLMCLALISSVVVAEFAYDEKTLMFFSKDASDSVDQVEFNEICYFLVESYCHSTLLVKKHGLGEQGLREALSVLSNQYGIQNRQNFLGLIILVQSILHLTKWEMDLLIGRLKAKGTPTSLRFHDDIYELLNMLYQDFNLPCL